MTSSRSTRPSLRSCEFRRLSPEALERRLLLSAVPAEEVAAAYASLTYRGSEASVRIAGDPWSPQIDPNVVQSTSRIDLDLLRSDPQFEDITGQGFAIAILDTGVDMDHPFFGPDSNGDGRADRIVYSWDFADDDFDAGDLNGHGTNVAGIAASQSAQYPGLAPEADLIILKVVDDSGFGQFADVETALQWVVAHVATYNIAAVNLSLSDNTNRPAATGDYGLDDELAALASLDVAIVAAAGNVYGPGAASGVGYPAADPHALAVGATWDGNYGGPQMWGSGAIDYTTGADRVASFSQRDDALVEVFAPGAWITSGGLSGGLSTYAGTSQATPHVAGTVLLAQQLAERELGRRLEVAELAELLASSGRTITDGDDEDDNVPNTGHDFSLLNVYQLAQEIVMLGTIHVRDSSPAEGEVVGSPTSVYTIHFSEPPDATTLSAGDFQVNGLPATSVTLLDADTARFLFSTSPVTAQGVQQMQMAAGAVKNAAGKDLAPFSAVFRYDASPMAVSGVDPASGQTVATPLTSLRFTLSEDATPSSLQTFDLWLARGTVSGASWLDSRTAVFLVEGLDEEGPLDWSLAAGAFQDWYGNPSLPAAGNLTLDIDRRTVDGFEVLEPASSGAFRAETSGWIQTTSDSDRFRIALEPGQRLSASVMPDAALRTIIDIYSPLGALLASTTGAAGGIEATINSFPASLGGVYEVAVRGFGGSQGRYEAAFWANTAIERENHGGGVNNQPALAQSLDPVFVALPGGASVATLQGKTDAEVTQVGPDGFGYLGVAVPFEFIDISGTGAALFANGQDNWWAKLSSAQLPGFAFNFYGTTYNELFLDTNGHITFGLEDSNPSNTDLMMSPFMATIAVLWDDLVMNLSADSRVYWQLLGVGGSQQLVIQWNNVRFNGAAADDRITFQVILNEANGAIQMNYLDLDSANPGSGGARATVGIKDQGFQVPPQGERRLVAAFNEGPNAFVGTGKSLRFAVGQSVTVSPDLYSITLTAGQPVSLAVTNQEYGQVRVDLVNIGGSVLAAGESAIEPASVVRNFVPTTSGTYYVLVSGQAGVEYALQVTRGVAPETETNDSQATAQSITPTGRVLGAVGYGFEPLAAVGETRASAFDVAGSPLSIGISSLGSFGGPTTAISYGGVEALDVGTLVSTYTVSLNGVDYTNGSGITSYSDFPVSLSEWSFGGAHVVRAVGTVVPGVSFERIVTWNDGDAHALVTTRIHNQSASSLTNVALLENQDPDPGELTVTVNDVSWDGHLGVAVSSAGALALGSLDPRAVVSMEGFVITNPFEILDSPNDPYGTAGDIAVNLAMRFGEVLPGESVEGTFAIVLGGTAELARATFAEIADATRAAGDDYYQIAVRAGDVLSLQTQTPGDGVSGLNPLDPAIDLYNVDGTLVASDENAADDGHNARLTHTATQTGAYTIRVRAAANTAGPYLLVAGGYTGPGSPGGGNGPPLPSAGGPYTVAEGGSVAFDASATFDPDAGDTLVFRWDLDHDGQYDDGQGMVVAVPWSQLVALGYDSGASMRVVRVQVDDGHGHVVNSSEAIVTIVNQAPSLSLIAPGGPVVRSFADSFQFLATDPSPGDAAAGFTYEIDWNGDGVYEEIVSGSSIVSLSHTFTDRGPRTVRARAVDRDGGVSEAAQWTVDVRPYAYITVAPGVTALRIGGTPGDDFLMVGEHDAHGPSPRFVLVLLTPQEAMTISIDRADGVQMAGGAGNDELYASALVSRGASLSGGDGDDLVMGGASNDVLLGGAGRDLLFGGRGTDLLGGEDGEDLLIAGRTIFDFDPVALRAVRAEWTSSRSQAQRIANLSGTGTGPRANGNYFLIPGHSVFDDIGADQLIGGDGFDWLWYDLLEDSLSDWTSGEAVVNLHNYPDGGPTGGGGQSL